MASTLGRSLTAGAFGHFLLHSLKLLGTNDLWAAALDSDLLVQGLAGMGVSFVLTVLCAAFVPDMTN